MTRSPIELFWTAKKRNKGEQDLRAQEFLGQRKTLKEEEGARMESRQECEKEQNCRGKGKDHQIGVELALVKLYVALAEVSYGLTLSNSTFEQITRLCHCGAVGR